MSDPAQPRAPEYPSAAMKEARQRLGASVADIANALHLEERVVVALEEGRHEELPARPYVRGYVRAYARLVGLNDDELSNRIEAALPKQTAPLRGPSPPVVLTLPKPTFAERAQRHLGVLFGVIVVAVLVGAALALWWVWRSYDWSFPSLGDEEPDAIAQAPSTLAGQRTVRPTPRSADEGRTAATVAGGLAPASESRPPLGESRPLDAETSLADLPSPSRALSSEPPLEEVVIVGSPDDEPPTAVLAFSFSEESWVEVHDGAGELIYADLGVAGQTVDVTGRAPFRILVGYAAGVRLTFNGDPVVLAPHTRQSVARLVVGH